MRYIGVDLAWGNKAETGLAVIDDEGHLLANELLVDLDTIVDFIARHSGDHCLVGVDAPLVVRNETGHRPCEKALAKRGTPAYPANRQLFQKIHGCVRGELLVSLLSEAGFVLTDRHPVELADGRFVFEVYPRAVLNFHAFDPLTGRSSLAPYKAKRGVSVGDIRKGIAEVRDLLGRLELPLLFDYAELVRPAGDREIETYSGRQLKSVADLLDALLCAYVVYSARSFGYAGGEIVGDLESGYILVPPQLANRRSHA